MRPRFLFLLLLSVLFWGALFFFIAPRTGGADVFVFKDAGANWALGSGFVSVSPSSPHEHVLYSSYPPGFALLYGIFCKVFGVGPRQNVFFDLVLGMTCALAWLLLLERTNLGKRNWSAYRIISVVVIFLVPTATLACDADRPEPLSLTLLLVALAMGISPKWRLVAWFLTGLNAIVSPFGAILTAWALAVVCLEEVPGAEAPVKVWRSRILGSLGALITAPLGFLLLYWRRAPEVLSSIFDHATGSSSGIGPASRIIGEGGLARYAELLRHGAFSSGFHSTSLFFSLLGVAVLVGVAQLQRPRVPVRTVIRMASIVGITLLTYLLFPKQNNYMAFTRNAILAISLWWATKSLSAAEPWYVATAFVGLCFLQLPLLARSIVIGYSEASTYEDTRSRIEAWKSDVEKREVRGRSIRVASSSDYYFILRPYFEVYPLYSAEPERVGEFDLVVFPSTHLDPLGFSHPREPAFQTVTPSSNLLKTFIKTDLRPVFLQKKN